MRTPKGRVYWAQILEPSFMFEKEGTPPERMEGQFKIDVYFQEKDIKDILAKFHAMIKIEAAENNIPVKEIKENMIKDWALSRKPEKPDPKWFGRDGEVRLRFKQKHRVFTAKSVTPLIFNISVKDNLNNPWNKSIEIGNESMCIIDFEAYSYCMSGSLGVACRLQGVQVCEFVSYDRDNVDFDQQDGDAHAFNDMSNVDDEDIDFGTPPSSSSAVTESEEATVSVEEGQDDIPF